MFFGIIIRMYYAPKEHNQPHIHVYFQDFTAVINIYTFDKFTYMACGKGNSNAKEVYICNY